MGYSNPGGSGHGYISTLTLSTGIVKTEQLTRKTAEIVSYDRCERNDSYFGQINMLAASSFCGPSGAVWGYHLAIADQIKDGTLEPLCTAEGIPVYDVKPLLDCTRRLFGVSRRKRFPLLPGAHVICAYKDATEKGPIWLWAAIGLAIAEDRSKAANLFIEDCSIYGDYDTAEPEVVDHLRRRVVPAVAKSALMCGKNQNVRYGKIFIGYAYEQVPPGSVGCALVCAPYVLLARDAIPVGGAASMIDMTISQWERALKLPPLPA